MNRVEISVAMCTYNGARYLSSQLESIAAQSELPTELVVCDDRSSDKTPQILEEFVHAAQFPVRLVHNPKNLGFTGNFEKAIGLCSREIIALADQDDVWHPDKLERIGEVFARDRTVGAVFSDAELIDADSRTLAKTLWDSVSFSQRAQDKFLSGEGLKVMLKHPVVTGATMAFRTEFKDLALPIPVGQIHDHWVALLVASVSQITPIKDPLIQYRRHAAQQIGPGNKVSPWQRISKRKRRDEYLAEADQFNQVEQRLRDRSFVFRPHSDALRMIEEKITHRRARGGLPSSRLMRIPSLLREVATLRYWRYSNGLGSVAKDLLVQI